MENSTTTSITDHLKNTIVVGVDPAPSKGLCVYAFNPAKDSPKNAGFQHYYAAKDKCLKAFCNHAQELANSQPVLICWDAPLTMPSGNVDFYTREIERVCRDARAGPNNGGWASVQAVAGCSHWAISQKAVGYPRFTGDSLLGSLSNPLLLTNNNDRDNLNKSRLYIVEVHPALAMQFKFGSAKVKQMIQDYHINDLANDESWKLSGTPSYKITSWTRANIALSGFARLWNITQKAFKDPDAAMLELPGPIDNVNMGDQPGPSDHLDAWVAMRLGMSWLNGNNVSLYGNATHGSFLLPTPQPNSAEYGIIEKLNQLTPPQA